MKLQQKTPAGQTIYRTLSLHIFGGGKVYLDSDIEKTRRSDHFPEKTGCFHESVN